MSRVFRNFRKEQNSTKCIELFEVRKAQNQKKKVFIKIKSIKALLSERKFLANLGRVRHSEQSRELGPTFWNQQAF